MISQLLGVFFLLFSLWAFREAMPGLDTALGKWKEKGGDGGGRGEGRAPGQRTEIHQEDSYELSESPRLQAQRHPALTTSPDSQGLRTAECSRGTWPLLLGWGCCAAGKRCTMAGAWEQPSQVQRQVAVPGSRAAQGPEGWMLLMRTEQERPTLANKPRLEPENNGQQQQALGRAGSHSGQIRFEGPVGWGGDERRGELQEVKAWKQEA